MEENKNNRGRQSSRSRMSFWNIIFMFCLGRKDKGEEDENERGFVRNPRSGGEEEKAAKERTNECRRMIVGPNLPIFMTCLHRPQENFEMQNVAGHRPQERGPQERQVAGRKRRLARRRCRTFYVPQSRTDEPAEIYDISVTYSPSPSDDEN